MGRWIVITLLGAVGVAGCFESHLNSRAGGDTGGYGGGVGGYGGGGFGGYGGGVGGYGGGGFGGGGTGGFGGYGGGGFGGGGTGGFGGYGGYGGGGFGGYSGFGGGGYGGFGGGCFCDDGDPCTADSCDPMTGWCTITPQQEICDQYDNDCDGYIDENAVQFRDADGDGFGDGLIGLVRSCEPQVGYVLNGDDCDDGTRDRYPGAPELCDRLDNDCDGVVEPLDQCPELYDCAAALALRCFPGATCVQEGDTARCFCPPGYLDRGSRTGEICEDVDECLYACPSPNTCINTPGSFQCTCAPSYVAWGGECLERCNEDCSAFANNVCVVLGAPICLCRPGFHDVYNGDGGYRDCFPD